MRRKIWIKRRRNSVKLDWRKTMRMWTIIVVVCVVVAFMLSGLVYAQPELKVGQEVELYVENGRTCDGIIVLLDERVYLQRPPTEICSVIHKDILVGYRILKPAPRPEFKLPSMKDYEGCLKLQNEGAVSGICPGPYKDHRDIADELRYLREEIKGLKK